MHNLVRQLIELRRKDGAHAAPAARFVIEKYASHKVYYALRLELGSERECWELPKGPSLDPAEKRLAIRIEPGIRISELKEGIVDGGTGQSAVIVWDEGSVHFVIPPFRARERGLLKFQLRGKKLRGSWMLARMGERADERKWLFLKESDEFANRSVDVTALFPASVRSATVIEDFSAFISLPGPAGVSV